MKKSVKFLVQAALIAALYATLTLVLGTFGYGPVQFRIAEALTLLPAIMPASIPGLVVGCMFANWIGGFGIIDVVFGSLASLLAAISTYLLRRHKFLYPFPPVLFNSIIVGSYVYFLFDNSLTLGLTMLSIGISELIICYGLGLPLITLIKKNPALRKVFEIED
ncbi:MAG: QueT transporter family protein [Clostridiaceae bacterium]|jgi:uncharacterized membrane protein|nr:QueT transporter family protein [Clostridiaceae bacterium]